MISKEEHSMPVIGTFTAIRDGYAGVIKTLTISAKVTFLVNNRREGDGAPDFRIVVGAVEVGAAWRRTKQGSEGTYLRVKIDDPCLPQPIWGALLEASDDGVARLVWRRDKREEG
jgi:uncharacterized protein (DUF736 family)